MTLCSPNKTPTSQTALGSDPEGPPIKENWKYPSVVGMLLYLSTNTRRDIAFAVSHVAQFTSNPKLSYALAVKMIIRYLSAISDQGIIFAQSSVFKADRYVDADFACLYVEFDRKEQSCLWSWQLVRSCLNSFPGLFLPMY